MWGGRFAAARNASSCLWSRQYNMSLKVRPLATAVVFSRFGERPIAGFPETGLMRTSPAFNQFAAKMLADADEDALNYLGEDALSGCDFEGLQLYLSSVSASSIKCNIITIGYHSLLQGRYWDLLCFK
jgi:hypothetical protein